MPFFGGLSGKKVPRLYLKNEIKGNLRQALLTSLSACGVEDEEELTRLLSNCESGGRNAWKLWCLLFCGKK